MYKIIRLFNTIKYLKLIQIYYRFFYYIRNWFRRVGGFSYSLSIPSQSLNLSLAQSIPSNNSYTDTIFTFLNISHKFDDKIDWNFSDFGKLWTYNLTYFEYLNQKLISKEIALSLINDFIDQIYSLEDGLEPFPISLRGINWIKFISQHNINDQKIDDSLYAQFKMLLNNLEYHLLGNHLLENGFSLLFGAYYFQDDVFYLKAKKILMQELNEQVLRDGAHFELSPMYHQIMLFRVLDCINLVKRNDWKNQELLELLKGKAEVMLGWINSITFENGKIPLLNDSANKIAPTTEELNKYAYKLLSDIEEDFKKSKIERLSDSGYRKRKNDKYEIVVDVGNIGPDYIPGHAHSDMFSFELYVHGHPLIVDTGISTYEANEKRQLERSTRSHNTVEINAENQSEMWGGFRVANRAKIIRFDETEASIEATHDGYQKKGIWHTRKFIFGAGGITIYDRIEGKKTCTSIAYLHFHPEIDVQLDENNRILCNNCLIRFSEVKEVLLEPYEYAPEFNKTIASVCARIIFDTNLEIKVSIL